MVSWPCFKRGRSLSFRLVNEIFTSEIKSVYDLVQNNPGWEGWYKEHRMAHELKLLKLTMVYWAS